jgi:2'-hydroxyisoflavone reductase
MSGRREFLVRAAAAGGVWVFGATGRATAAAPRRALSILILGGTGSIGPYHVHAASERGHRVCVFSRGRSVADLPPGVERLIGDRNNDLRSIAERDWDAVLDIATFGPGWVRSLGQTLKGRVRHYTFVSTISVYDHPEANRTTRETSAVLPYRGSADPYLATTEGPDYGALKVLAEHEAEKQFPDRTLVLRPGYIAGPGDTHAPFPYWVLRVQRGGARARRLTGSCR